ncbi:MAG TPA: proton-conducting transporter membrane subunit, partial [Fimbriimonadaceae bacterium]|nr:proton-conducting transporter membrane subunit [Fimbriimonadaceae bacterium]
FMASLIGIPPTAGFFGKLYIFADAVRSDLVVLAIALAVNSIISIYYYLGIALAAFVAEEEEGVTTARMHPGLATTCVICVAGLLLAALFISPLTAWITGPAEAAVVAVR